MRNKTVLALLGTNGVGKGTVAKVIQQLVPSSMHFTYSTDVLLAGFVPWFNRLKEAGEPGTENLAFLAFPGGHCPVDSVDLSGNNYRLKDSYREFLNRYRKEAREKDPHVFSAGMLALIKAADTDLVLADGTRMEQDYELLIPAPPMGISPYLIEVTADSGARAERIAEVCGCSADEAHARFAENILGSAEFEAMDLLNDRYRLIAQKMRRYRTIDNSGSLEDLTDKVGEVLRELGLLPEDRPLYAIHTVLHPAYAPG